MQRWVNYHTMRMQKLLPLEMIKAAACVLVILCLLTLCFLLFRSRKQRKPQKQEDRQRGCRRRIAADAIMFLFLAVSGAAFLFLAAAFSVRELSSYYFILLLTGIAFLCAGIRNVLAVKLF